MQLQQETCPILLAKNSASEFSSLIALSSIRASYGKPSNFLNKLIENPNRSFCNGKRVLWLQCHHRS